MEDKWVFNGYPQVEWKEEGLLGHVVKTFEIELTPVYWLIAMEEKSGNRTATADTIVMSDDEKCSIGMSE